MNRNNSNLELCQVWNELVIFLNIDVYGTLARNS